MTTFFTLPTVPSSSRQPSGIPGSSGERGHEASAISIAQAQAGMQLWTSVWPAGSGRADVPQRAGLERLIERSGAVVSELMSALDALAADDLHALPAGTQ